MKRSSSAMSRLLILLLAAALTLDPLAAMAQTDKTALADLLATLDIQTDALSEMLDKLSQQSDLLGELNQRGISCRALIT